MDSTYLDSRLIQYIANILQYFILPIQYIAIFSTTNTIYCNILRHQYNILVKIYCNIFFTNLFLRSLGLYHTLLNASLCLIQVSLFNNLFPLKSEYFECGPILDPILSRSTHDYFAWIDNFYPVWLQNNLFYLAHFIWSIYL